MNLTQVTFDMAASSLLSAVHKRVNLKISPSLLPAGHSHGQHAALAKAAAAPLQAPLERPDFDFMYSLLHAACCTSKFLFNATLQVFWRRTTASGGAPRWLQSAPLALPLQVPLERADVVAAHGGAVRVLAVGAAMPAQALVLAVSGDPTCLTATGALKHLTPSHRRRCAFYFLCLVCARLSDVPALDAINTGGLPHTVKNPCTRFLIHPVTCDCWGRHMRSVHCRQAARSYRWSAV